MYLGTHPEVVLTRTLMDDAVLLLHACPYLGYLGEHIESRPPKRLIGQLQGSITQARSLDWLGRGSTVLLTTLLPSPPDRFQ